MADLFDLLLDSRVLLELLPLGTVENLQTGGFDQSLIVEKRFYKRNGVNTWVCADCSTKLRSIRHLNHDAWPRRNPLYYWLGGSSYECCSVGKTFMPIGSRAIHLNLMFWMSIGC